MIRNMSNYQYNLRRLAEMFKALSNHHRLEIFLRLASCCPSGTRSTTEEESRRFVGDLALGLKIAPSTVSHHIKELRQSGLITVERIGKNIECRVDEQAVAELAALLDGRAIIGNPRQDVSDAVGSD
jgi:ArsR family transcriptional regulator, arsenate/arsenite/antimonite-responsive transcriptional repressor